MKFAVYEPLPKTKDSLKAFPHQSLSSANLDNLRKLPGEYSTLRQTLSFKPTNFDSLMHDDDNDKLQKPNSILRQTMSNKSSFRPKTEKSFSESLTQQNTQSTFDLNHKGDPQGHFYSRKTNYVLGSKSCQVIEQPNM